MVPIEILRSTTVFNIDNKKCFLSTKISEGSRDTENWINNAENVALPSQE